MTEDNGPETTDSIDAPEPIVEKGRGVSLIWVIPIVALIAGAVLAFDTYRNRGIKVIITLPDAEWVEAGKTKVKYLDIEIGTVDSVEVRQDLKGVELHATLHRPTQEHLTEEAMFWLVHPRVGAGGVSDLGTLLSGAYIAMLPGATGGTPTRTFKGLVDPPLRGDTEEGLTIELHSDQLSSLDAGAPIFHREFKVGTVDRAELDENGSGVTLTLFFPEEHAALIRKDSRFWNAGGIQISGSLSNLDIVAESLDSIIAGGIAFDSPRGAKSKAAESGDSFWLHPSKNDLKTYPFRYGGLRIYIEGDQLGSLALHDPVYYRKLPVGAVISQELMNDSRNVRVGLNIQKRYETLVRSNSKFWNASGITANLSIKGLQIHAESVHSILKGGVAFATPDSPGHLVKPGSVFRMHHEVKDEWLAWSPLIWRGPAGQAPVEAKAKAEKAHKHHGFFHHEKKSEEDADASGESTKDPSQESAHETKRHGFFHHLFHQDDDKEQAKEPAASDPSETSDATPQ